MHITVASLHRLPVEGFGGPPRVAMALVQGLAALGHRVTLLAPPGTRAPAATVVEQPPRVLRDAAQLRRVVPSDSDCCHAHYPLATAPDGPPFVQTVHGNLKDRAKPLPHAIYVSANHARRHGSETFVYNGLDPAEFVFRRRKEQWDLYLGRLHSAKGYQWAVEAAKQTGRRLIIAGGWRPSFTGTIKFVGEVDGSRKAALLARARCHWAPAQWDEPFGLTIIEALFSGTPVLGTRRGALPELLTPEVGALCDTLDEMIVEAETIGTRDPVACRAQADRYFTHLAMAEEYVRLYRHLAETGALPPGHPTPYSR
jgi:glycosyltransferase involved in cell wall biosynthesis